MKVVYEGSLKLPHTQFMFGHVYQQRGSSEYYIASAYQEMYILVNLSTGFLFSSPRTSIDEAVKLLNDADMRLVPAVVTVGSFHE